MDLSCPFCDDRDVFYTNYSTADDAAVNPESQTRYFAMS